MDGPYPPGNYSQLAAETKWGQCIFPGQRYRVIKPFVDFDGVEHSEGEEWYFIGSKLTPYDNGLSVFVADDDRNEWRIRLCWRPEDQEHICNQFNEYVASIDHDLRPEYSQRANN